MSGITHVLEAIGRDGDEAPAEFLSLVYNELRRLAAARMARETPDQTLQPTALVHEVWLRISGNGGGQWRNTAHFFAAASEAMRRILIENARRKSRLKRGGGRTRINIDELDIAAATRDDQLLMIDEAVEELEAADPAKSRIVVMKFFGGLTNQEIGKSLGVTERTIERQWAYARAWLYEKIRERY